MVANPITLFSDQLPEPCSMHSHTYVSDDQIGNNALTALGIFNEGGQPIRIHFNVDDEIRERIATTTNGSTVELEVNGIGVQIEGSIERDELIRMFEYILQSEKLNSQLMRGG